MYTFHPWLCDVCFFLPHPRPTVCHIYDSPSPSYPAIRLHPYQWLFNQPCQPPQVSISVAQLAWVDESDIESLNPSSSDSVVVQHFWRIRLNLTRVWLVAIIHLFLWNASQSQENTLWDHLTRLRKPYLSYQFFLLTDFSYLHFRSPKVANNPRNRA